MTPQRLQRLESGLNSLERKVLAGTPIAEAWTVNQVCQELRRQGQSHDQAHVTACLKQMIDKGVVREPKAGLYQRQHARPVQPAPQIQLPPARALTQETPMPPPTPVPPAEPLSAIAALSQRLRGAAGELTALAGQLDDLALDVEDRLQRISADSQRLRQLRALLTEGGDATAGR